VRGTRTLTENDLIRVDTPAKIETVLQTFAVPFDDPRGTPPPVANPGRAG